MNYIAYCITGVSPESSIDIRSSFLSCYDHLLANGMGLSPQAALSMSSQNTIDQVDEYIRWVHARFSWFRVACFRKGSGKSDRAKQEIAYKISEVERKIGFFCKQLTIASHQKMSIPEPREKPSLALRMMESVKTRLEFLWKKETPFPRLRG